MSGGGSDGFDSALFSSVFDDGDMSLGALQPLEDTLASLSPAADPTAGHMSTSGGSPFQAGASSSSSRSQADQMYQGSPERHHGQHQQQQFNNGDDVNQHHQQQQQQQQFSQQQHQRQQQQEDFQRQLELSMQNQSQAQQFQLQQQQAVHAQAGSRQHPYGGYSHPGGDDAASTVSTTHTDDLLTSSPGTPMSGAAPSSVQHHQQHHHYHHRRAASAGGIIAGNGNGNGNGNSSNSNNGFAVAGNFSGGAAETGTDLSSVGVTSSGSSRGGTSSAASVTEETRRKRAQRQGRQRDKWQREMESLQRRAEHLESGIRIRDQQIASLTRSNSLLTAQCAQANALIAEKDDELGRLGQAMLWQTYGNSLSQREQQMRIKQHSMHMAQMQSAGQSASTLSSSSSSSSAASQAGGNSTSGAMMSAGRGSSNLSYSISSSHSTFSSPGRRLRIRARGSGVTSGVDAQIDEMTFSILSAILDDSAATGPRDARTVLGPVFGIVAECTRLCEEVSKTPSNPKVPIQEYWVAVADEAMRLNDDQRHQIAQLASVHTAKLNELHVFRSGLLDAIRAVTRVRAVAAQGHGGGGGGGSSSGTGGNNYQSHHTSGGGGGFQGFPGDPSRPGSFPASSQQMGDGGTEQDKTAAAAAAAEHSFESALSCAQVLPQIARNLEADRSQRRIFHRAFMRVVTPMQAVQLLMMCFGVH